MPAFLEERYRRKHLNCVRHITLDPKGTAWCASI